MAPGSVNMRDADASDISEEYQDDSASLYSSDNDDFDADIGRAGAGPSNAQDKQPYRVIDADLLKKVQVRISTC